MKHNIKTLQDIAYNIGYADGLVRVSQNRGLKVAEINAYKEFVRLARLWENEKAKYINTFEDTQCPVVKQLTKVLLEDRAKHFNYGLIACSDKYAPRKQV